MTDVPDARLLEQFARNGSEEAFAALVQRHIALVHSVALRHTANAQHAQDITQAVFVILARKAGSLGRKTVLPGWLYHTARLTAANLQRAEMSRVRREQEAFMQSQLEESVNDALWRELSPQLDEAMAGLGTSERDALVLRYFQNKSMAEVGQFLGLAENTAQKRVSRALEKLRAFFTKRGVTSTTAIIAGAISANSVQAVPVALAKSVTAVAIAKGAAASGSILALVKATLIAMKTKTIIVASIAAAAVILGTGTYLTFKSLQPKTAPADALPIKFANDDFKDPAANPVTALLLGGNRNSGKFLNEVDPDTRRTTNSSPAGHIKCLVASTSTGSADYLNSLPSAFERGLAASRYNKYFIHNDSSLFGKRIRITGWMKTSDVRNWAGVDMVVANTGGHIFAYDGMFDRPLHGTTGWQQVEFVTDIPREPCVIALSPTLYGTGEMWCDDFQIDVVPSNTPTTDDRTWNVWCQNPCDYSETTDSNVTHDGHPALCIAYISHEAPQKYSFVWWGQHNRDLETFKKYRGHTVRMSIWAKSDYILGNSGLNLEPKGVGGRTLAKHSAFGKTQIRDTSDWAEHSITCVIPKDTEDFQTGFFIFGPGKLWLDMDSFKCEIVK